MNGRDTRLRISVVVPSWHDAENLAALLPVLSRLERVAETIVVDAHGDAIESNLGESHIEPTDRS